MPFFKDKTGALHYLDDASFSNLLPSGSVQISDEEAESIRAQQSHLTQAQIEADFTALIQRRLDDFVRQRNYDNILSACTYASSAVARFKAEGQACVNLRDATWAAAYDILVKVQEGHRPMPKGLSDIEADLPTLEWPQ